MIDIFRWAAPVSVLLSLLLLAPIAGAQDRLTPRLRFDGFGTVGLVYSTNDRADFVENTTRSEGAGANIRYSFPAGQALVSPAHGAAAPLSADRCGGAGCPLADDSKPLESRAGERPQNGAREQPGTPGYI